MDMSDNVDESSWALRGRTLARILYSLMLRIGNWTLKFTDLASASLTFPGIMGGQAVRRERINNIKMIDE